MESYVYSYPPQYPSSHYPEGQYPDHGDGFGDYYAMGPMNEDLGQRSSRSKHRIRKRHSRRSRSRGSVTESRSRSRSKTRSRSRSKTRSRSRLKTQSRSRSCTRSRSVSRPRELNLKEPGFLDAFRVLYLTSRKHKKDTAKYLSTKKRQDRIQEALKSDGLGSKRWFFYPRSQQHKDPNTEGPWSRPSCDQRVKMDEDFFRKYKKSKKVAADAPIAKLKRWELILYKKLGFIQAV